MKPCREASPKNTSKTTLPNHPNRQATSGREEVENRCAVDQILNHPNHPNCQVTSGREELESVRVAKRAVEIQVEVAVQLADQHKVWSLCGVYGEVGRGFKALRHLFYPLLV